MYQNYCPCYLHLYMACFLTNCLQIARNAASDNLFFQNFLGENTTRPPFGLAPAALDISRRRRSYAPPSKNPGYGPVYLYVWKILTELLFPSRNFSSVYWTRYWHYAYGNCYVFNGGKDKTGQKAPVLKSNKPGPSHGRKAHFKMTLKGIVFRWLTMH